MKPTQAKIEFFCHPDQAWLQEEWEPAVGDWFLWREHREMGAMPEHVCVVSEIEDPQEIDELEGEVYWLPTLSDLLGMIEKKGIAWGGYLRNPSEGNGYVFYAKGTTTVGQGATKTIAAAELLKKLKMVGTSNDRLRPH